LPNNGAGLNNTVDPDDGTASQSIVDLSTETDGVAVNDGIVLNQDFGYVPVTPNTVSGTLWNDLNGDGTLEGIETGRFDGVTVILRDSDGEIVGATVTDTDGNYSFGNLPDGAYSVEIDDQDGSLEGFWHSDGSNDGADNNSQINGYSVTVGGGTSDSTGDFGYFKAPASVGNLIWNDLNGDGDRDAGEPGVEGVLVSATVVYDNGSTITITTLTDSKGEYSFDNLLLDEDYLAGGSGSNQPTYVIQVEPPPGMSSTHTLSTDTADADNLADDPTGEFVALVQGASLVTKDFGFQYNGSIGDYVWLDSNGDGKQDLSESPLGGVTVKLYNDFDINGVFDPGGADGAAIDTVITALDGSYLFANLPEGDYWVQIDSGVPAGLEVSTTHENITDTSKPADLVPLAANASEDTVDFGFNATTTAMLGDTVWFDVDPDGTGPQLPDGFQNFGEIGIAGVGLYICLNDVIPCDGTTDIDTGSINPTVVTGPDGSWLVTGLTQEATYTVVVDTGTLPAGIDISPTNGDIRRVYTLPTPASADDSGSLLVADYGFTDNDATQNYGSIGDRVYSDENGDDDDENGSDPGLSGVTVELLVGGVVVSSTTTDATGGYNFTGLALDTEYTVQIKSDNLILSDMTRTQTGPDNDTYVFTPTVAVPNNTAADFGFQGSASELGDYVWFDSDGDGEQGVSENGISNVDVKLYLDNGSVLGQYDSGDTLVRSTTTDSNGRYLFNGIAIDANYIVKAFPPANFIATAVDAAGGDDSKDSDGNASGEVSLTFTETTMDVDLGFKGDGPTYSIGDTVWYDSDGQGDLNEVGTGIDGVTVELYLDDQRLATTVTSGGGAYIFDNLPPNTYEIRITDENNVLDYLVSTTGGSTQDVGVVASDLTDINFGFNQPSSTYATVSTFAAYMNSENRTVLEWKTDSEVGTLGFFLERLNERSGAYERVTRNLLPGMLSPPHGGTYRFVDKQAAAGKAYSYRVVEVAANGQGTVSGPYTVEARLPLPVNRQLFADGPEGYSLTHGTFSKKQLKRFAARDAFAAKSARHKRQRIGGTLKIPVAENGLVYLSAARLAEFSGLSEHRVRLRLKSQRCLLTLGGVSIPVIISNSGSGLWFYGHAPTRNDIGQNIYRLKLDVLGMTMENAPGRARETVSDERSFAARTKIEENHYPLHMYMSTPVNDLWAWEYLFAYGGEHTVHHAVDASRLTGEGTAALTVNLVGVANSVTSGQAAPYRVVVYLNDTALGTAEWSGHGDYRFRAEIDAGLLRDSGNEVRLVSRLNNGVLYSFIYLESIELDYLRDHTAVNGELFFTGGEHGSETVKGFSGGNVLALDITDPDRPHRLRTLPGKNQSGEYTVTVLTEPGHEYFVTANTVSTVSGDITVDTPSRLRVGDNQAEYLIISPSNLIDSAQRLADLREAQGLLVKIVDIENIQDEFSHGLAAPEAVHDFLAHAYANWITVPRYVVLIGDGSYDYRNHLGYGYPLVPAVLTATPEGFFPSDNLFADVIGDDGVPEFAIGRIPVADSAELNTYIDKLLSYEQSLHDYGVVMALVTDQSDPLAGDFQASADKVAGFMPEDIQVNRFDLDAQGESITHNRIVSTLQQGTGILHYIGHGSLTAYGRRNSLLTADQVDTMSSIGPPMLMTSMSCSSASFGYPALNSIGESAVLRADGAAVGFFGSTGLSLNYLADIMAEGFYRSLFDPENPRVGDAIVQGKQYCSDQGVEMYVFDIFNFIGDPAVLAPGHQ
ncbi:MAG: hypothetical protein D3924_04585, partial [Candidatus Electrothrix sp. AR4]|nr:hypothetical protein [Candidatus Electrothrix sp. AR4]